MAYFLRTRRNDYLHNHKFDHPNSIISKVYDKLNLIWSQAPTNPIHRSFLNHTVSIDKWQKPPVGILKINWDATFDINKGRICVGAIIWNREGQFVGALKAGRSLTHDSFVVESLTLLLAVKLCRDLEIQRIFLEGDASQVINLTKEKSIDWSEGGTLVQDALTMCKSFA